MDDKPLQPYTEDELQALENILATLPELPWGYDPAITGSEGDHTPPTIGCAEAANDDLLWFNESCYSPDELNAAGDFIAEAPDVVRRLIYTVRAARTAQIPPGLWAEATETIQDLAASSQEITRLLKEISTCGIAPERLEPSTMPMTDATDQIIRGLTFINEVATAKQRGEVLERLTQVFKERGWSLP